jgi:hypothetical protein
MMEDRPTSANVENGPVLKHSVVSARSWERYTITTDEGKPATLAILDERGQVLDAGPQVAQEIWDLAIIAYRQYLRGEGYLRVTSSPEGLFQETAD